MTSHYSETEVIAMIPGLTQTSLTAFVQAELLVPAMRDGGWGFDAISVARLALLTDLTLHFDVGDDALAIVISLIDQLHAAQGDLAAMAVALSVEPVEVRRRVGRALMTGRTAADRDGDG